jgi:hypothetical protein
MWGEGQIASFQVGYADLTELHYAGRRPKTELIPIVDYASMLALG